MKEDKIRQDKIIRISKISIFISPILYTKGAPKAKPPTARACFVSIRGLGADWEEPFSGLEDPQYHGMRTGGYPHDFGNLHTPIGTSGKVSHSHSENHQS